MLLRLLVLLLLLLLLLGRTVEERWRHGLSLGSNVALFGLRGKLSLGFVSVSLALSILFEGVLHCDLVAEDILAVEIVNGGVAALKVTKADEAKSFASAVVVACNFG